MQVLFVDVAQGSCQIVLLGNRKAIVVDSGSNPSLALRVLRVLRIEAIELLVASHSHADHVGGFAKATRFQSGVTGILSDYADSISRIAYVFDSSFKDTAFGKYLVKLLKERRLSKEQLKPISADIEPQELWRSPDGLTRIGAISPLGGTGLIEWDAKQPNSSSAIIELRHHNDRIVFAADSEYDQWRDIHRLRGSTRMKCKAIAMPHHGGLMAGSAADLKWFCEQAIDAEVAVFSVGTVNSYQHPRLQVIRAIASSGSIPMCTQITSQCCNDLELLRPGVIGPMRFPCASKSRPDKTRSGFQSRNVACAGTIAATLNEQGIQVESVDEHQDGVNTLISLGGTPMCR